MLWGRGIGICEGVGGECGLMFAAERTRTRRRFGPVRLEA